MPKSNLDPKDSDKPASVKDKMTEKLNEFKNSEKVGSVLSFAKENTKDTIAYVILFSGILICLFHHLTGGALIGLVVGFYYSATIMAFVRNIGAFVDKEGIFRALILGGLLAGIFIAAPVFFLGTAAAIAIATFFISGVSASGKKDKESK